MGSRLARAEGVIKIKINYLSTLLEHKCAQIAGKVVVDKAFTVLVCLLIFFCMLIPAYGASNASNRRTVRIGYFRYDGFYNSTNDGKKSGYGYEILQKLRVYENWNYEYIGYDENTSWQDMVELLEKGQIDLLAPANYTQERGERFNYSSLPIGYSSTILSVKANNRKYSTSDYSNWHNIVVGMIASKNKNSRFYVYAQKHGFTYRPVVCKDAEELAAKLKSGEIDLAVTSSLVKLTNVWTIDEFEDLGVYYLVNKGNTSLLEQLNDGLSRLAKDEPDYQDRLFQKYYGNSSGKAVQFSEKEQAYIEAAGKSKKVYYAVLNPNRKPLSYYENKQMKGLLLDISKEIFARTGLDIRFVVLDSRAKYYEMIKNKSVDIICDYTGDFGKAESSKFVLLESYYSSSISRLARRDSGSKGNRCAIVGNSISSWLQGKNYEFVYFDTVEDCCKAVLNGSADFIFSYTKCIQEMVNDDRTNSLMAISESYKSTDFAMAVTDTQDALLCSILNKSIASITKNDIANIADDYTYYDKQDTSLQSFIYRNPLVFGASVFLFAALVFGVVVLILVLRRNSAEVKNAATIKRALEISEIATKEKNEFYARMSHDMRTPMNGILGVSELSLEENNPQVLQENMRKIHASGEYLLELINDTLDLQRIEGGKLTLEYKVVSVKELIVSGTDAITQIAREKGVSFSIINNNADLTGYIRTDPIRLKQIFINLLSNAVKFTPSGGAVRLIITVLGCSAKVTHVRMEITDTGVGMSPDFIAHKIFLPFSQEHNAMTDNYAGSGLGLSIVKSLVEMMGAAISVESELGVGTKFTVNIDFERVAAEDAQHVAVLQKESQKEVIERLRGARILLAEDQKLNAEIARKLLEKVGCELVWVQNGLECVNAFTGSEPQQFDIILMDIRMPIMDGLSATKAIRSSDHIQARTIPIIAMTANAYAEDIKVSYEAGMNEHIAKPINTQVLYATLARYLAKEPSC